MSGQGLAVPAPPSIATKQRGAFDPEQVALIQATVMPPETTQAELALFLETCVRHQLDPFIKEVWAIRYKGKVQTVVARDGLLKVANRCTGPGWVNVPGEFLGCPSNVVHEYDHFDFWMETRDDGTERWHVDHRPRSSEGKAVFGGKDGKGRGEIAGSWARVRRRGHDDVLFIAYRAEYDKAGQRGGEVWSGFPHAMMQKVAEAMALRKAFSVAGVVGEGELERVPENPSAGSGEVVVAEIGWPEDEELRRSLEDGFRALGYKRAKVRALVNACESVADFEGLLARLNAEADEAASIQDAEVVETVGEHEPEPGE